MAEAIVVFPREETFGTDKNINTNILLREVKEELDLISSKDVNFIFFAEDTVSYVFAQLYKHRYLSLLSQKEKLFMLANVDGLGDKYKNVFLKTVDYKYISEANKSIKIKQRSEFTSDIDYITSTYQSILRKIRYTATAVMKDSRFIVYFDRNNQYCSLPKINYGENELLIWKKDLNSTNREFSYGGLNVNDIKLVFQIIESRC